MRNKNKKLIIISSSIIFLLAFFSCSNLAYASEITVSKVIELVNKAREGKEINSLEENVVLDKIAQDKLEDMIKNNYFAHTSPKGVTPWSWFEKEGYDYKYAGENLAINFLTAESQQKAWMDSPTHKKNIMNPQFQEIGVAVAAGEINNQLAIITVQEFGTLAGAGDAANKKENFSGKEKNNIIKEETKIAPTVLSVKDESKGNYLDFGKDAKKSVAFEKNYLSDIKNYFSQNKNLIFEKLQIVSVIIMLLTMLLMPAVFILEALKTIRIYLSFNRIFRSDSIAESK